MFIKFNKLKEDVKSPTRKYSLDAGVDVFMPKSGKLKPGINCIPLGIGVEIPNGYMGSLYPRSSLSKLGIFSLMAPIDSGYTGEIHLFIFNGSNESYKYEKNDRLCQLIVHNIAVVNLLSDDVPLLERKANGLGSSGK